MRKRLLATLLVIALLASLMTTGVMAAPYDGGETGGSTPSTTSNVSNDNNEVYVAKSLSGKGTDEDPYKLTLEAWVQGNVTPEESQPMDIVLVLDVSGSMDDSFSSTTTYEYYTYDLSNSNSDYWNWDSRNNLWVQLSNGEYAQVELQASRKYEYVNFDNQTNARYYNNRNNLYSYNEDTESYEEVDVSVNRWNETYTYAFSDGTQIRSTGRQSRPELDRNVYLRQETSYGNYIYTYTYTDENGVEQVYTSEGSNTRPELTLYYRRSDTQSTSKLEAMQSAVSGFITQVSGNSAQHRIAIVKFADDSYYEDYDGNNIVGDNKEEWTGYNYTQVVKDFTYTSSDGSGELTTALNALTAGGATAADYGLDLAAQVFRGTGATLGGARQDAKKVVVFFTDGDPTHSSSFSNSVAEDAVDSAYNLKTSGATVYTVGIFAGANPSDTETNTNRFMNAVSSNYPSAQSGSGYGFSVSLGDRTSGNYYFAASDAKGLEDIFETIGGDITSEEVDEASTLSDTLSEYFDFGDSITIGQDGNVARGVTASVVPATNGTDNSPAWDGSPESANVTVTVNGDEISVSGFNYSDESNVVVYNDGSWQGNKLVITFPIEVDEAACISKPIESGIYPTNAITSGNEAGLRYGNSGVLLDESPTVNVGNVSYNGTDITVEVYVDGVKQTSPLTVVDIARYDSSNFNNFRLVSNDSGTLTYDFDYNPDNGNDCVDIDVKLKDNSTYIIQGVEYLSARGSEGSNGVNAITNGVNIDNVTAGSSDPDVKIYLRTVYSVEYYKDTTKLTEAPYNDTNKYLAEEDVEETSTQGPSGEESPVWFEWKTTEAYSTEITLPVLPKADTGKTIDGWFNDETKYDLTTTTTVDVNTVVPEPGTTIIFTATQSDATGTVVINYQNEDEEPIKDSTTKTGNVGSSYEFTVGSTDEIPFVINYSNADGITTKYVFDHFTETSADLSGTYKSEQQTITAVYKVDSTDDDKDIPDDYIATVTYKVVNGTWTDTDDDVPKTATFVTKTFNTDSNTWVDANPTLDDQGNTIPTAQPNSNYVEPGAWHTGTEGLYTPATVGEDTIVNGDITYTYIYNTEKTEGLTVSKTVTGMSGAEGMAKPDDTLNYTITVTNTGNTERENIEITDTFMVGDAAGELRFAETENDGFSVTRNAETGVYTITIEKLAAADENDDGGDDTITITATYTVADTDAGKTITNTAVADDGNPDTDDDPSGSTETEVEDPAYTITKELTSAKRGETTYTGESLDTYKARVGDVLTYAIKVENTGNVSLNNLTLTDTFTGAGTLNFDEAADGAGYSVEDNDDGTYTITITDLSSESGQNTLEITATYTVEDGDVANGSFTNTVTDNAGGEPDEDDPTVPVEMDDYTVTITVADMLIYTGGNPYGGIAGADGDIIDETQTSGLPEPGYHLILSEAVVAWLNENDVPAGDGLTNDAARLDDVLTFSYAQGNETRNWPLSYIGRYSATQYVYRIEADTINNIPIRITYTNSEGQVVSRDDIDMSPNSVNETFTMEINPGDLNQALIKAVFEANGAKISAGIELVKGALEIRSTTGDEYTSQVGGDNDAPGKITADANEDTQFFINETQVELAGDELARVHLLVDDVSDSEEFNAAMGADAINVAPAGVSLTNARYVLAYMDLVDSGNGNAVITMNEGGSVKVYWPMPADAAADSEFYIVHYTGLDRDSVITADALDNAAKDIISGDEITVEDGYITFDVSSFSPFALVYEQKSADAPNVEVTKTVSDRTPEVGDTVRYTVTVTNTGNTVLNNVTVTDTMWENGTVIYVDGQRQVLTGDEYSIDSIAVGSSVVITYYYSVTRSDANDEITNHVEVTVPDGPSDETETTIDVDPYMPNIPDPDDDPDPVEPDFDFVPNWLNTTDHFAYIVGYEDGTIRPTNNITRAEVATIFFRLLTDDAREKFWSQTNDYTDVASDAWYNNAVSTLSNMGIIDGYEDGTFKPNASITRAEFTAIATRFFDYTAEYEGAFNDVTYSDWYADCVQAAVDMGLVNGYADGGFHPNAYITRAESCAIVNRVLNRVPHEDYLLDEDEMITWPDNSYGAWYYADMQEATNSHDYDWISVSGEVVEEWTDKLAERDWEALEQQWSTAYSG